MAFGISSAILDAPWESSKFSDNNQLQDRKELLKRRVELRDGIIGTALETSGRFHNRVPGD